MVGTRSRDASAGAGVLHTHHNTHDGTHGLAHRCRHRYQYADSSYPDGNPVGSANCDAHPPSHGHGSCHSYIFTPRPPLRLES